MPKRGGRGSPKKREMQSSRSECSRDDVLRYLGSLCTPAAPLTIARGVGLSFAREVNPTLHALQSEGVVIKESTSPPRWRLATNTTINQEGPSSGEFHSNVGMLATGSFASTSLGLTIGSAPGLAQGSAQGSAPGSAPGSYPWGDHQTDSEGSTDFLAPRESLVEAGESEDSEYQGASMCTPLIDNLRLSLDSERDNGRSVKIGRASDGGSSPTADTYKRCRMDPNRSPPLALSPQALSPQTLSSQALSPQALSPQALSLQALSSLAVSPQALSSEALSPQELSSEALALSPQALSSDTLSPQALSSESFFQQAASFQPLPPSPLSPKEIAGSQQSDQDDYIPLCAAPNSILHSEGTPPSSSSQGQPSLQGQGSEMSHAEHEKQSDFCRSQSDAATTVPGDEDSQEVDMMTLVEGVMAEDSMNQSTMDASMTSAQLPELGPLCMLGAALGNFENRVNVATDNTGMDVDGKEGETEVGHEVMHREGNEGSEDKWEEESGEMRDEGEKMEVPMMGAEEGRDEEIRGEDSYGRGCWSSRSSDSLNGQSDQMDGCEEDWDGTASQSQSEVHSTRDMPKSDVRVGSLEQRILSALQCSKEQIVLLNTLVHSLGCVKKDVNRTLYGMEKNGLVRKVQDMPPKWGLGSATVGQPVGQAGASRSWTEGVGVDIKPERFTPPGNIRLQGGQGWRPPPSPHTMMNHPAHREKTTPSMPAATGRGPPPSPREMLGMRPSSVQAPAPSMSAHRGRPPPIPPMTMNFSQDPPARPGKTIPSMPASMPAFMSVSMPASMSASRPASRPASTGRGPPPSPRQMLGLGSSSMQAPAPSLPAPLPGVGRGRPRPAIPEETKNRLKSFSRGRVILGMVEGSDITTLASYHDKPQNKTQVFSTDTTAVNQTASTNVDTPQSAHEDTSSSHGVFQGQEQNSFMAAINKTSTTGHQSDHSGHVFAPPAASSHKAPTPGSIGGFKPPQTPRQMLFGSTTEVAINTSLGHTPQASSVARPESTIIPTNTAPRPTPSYSSSASQHTLLPQQQQTLQQSRTSFTNNHSNNGPQGNNPPRPAGRGSTPRRPPLPPHLMGVAPSPDPQPGGFPSQPISMLAPAPMSTQCVAMSTIPASNMALAPAVTLGSDAFAALNKNPVSALMEYAQARHSSATIEVLSQQGPSHKPKFMMAAVIGKRTFPGVQCSNKKDGRVNAADLALRTLMAEGEYQQQSTGPSKGLSHPATHFDSIAALAHQKFNQLAGMVSMVMAGRKVMAALVMKHRDDDPGEVVALGTGNRCITGRSLSLEGQTVNDSHAEIITRRSFMRYLYAQLMAYKQNAASSILEAAPGGRMRVRPGVTFHLYISTAPCGDGALFSPRDCGEDQPCQYGQQHAPIFTSKLHGLLRTKMEGGEGTIPVDPDAGPVSWDGLLRGERLRTMSCSDKLCRWNLLGLQGALLSNLVEPVYLASLTLGSLYEHNHLARSMCCRLSHGEPDIQPQLPGLFKVNHPYLGRVTAFDPPRETQKTKELSMNWTAGDPQPEITDGTKGICVNVRSLDAQLSQVASCKLYASFLRVCAEYGQQGLVTAGSYYDAKMASKDFQKTKHLLFQKMKGSGYGQWVVKPTESKMFTG